MLFKKSLPFNSCTNLHNLSISEVIGAAPGTVSTDATISCDSGDGLFLEFEFLVFSNFFGLFGLGWCWDEISSKSFSSSGIKSEEWDDNRLI